MQNLACTACVDYQQVTNTIVYSTVYIAVYSGVGNVLIYNGLCV